MKTIVIIDDTDPRLSPAWRFWASLAVKIESIDEAFPVKSWGQAFERLFDTKPSRIQLWHHGGPGNPLIAGRGLPVSGFDLFKDLRLHGLEQVWFRSCAVFAGNPGQRFASHFSEHTGLEVAAHTYNIGHYGFQSGLHTYHHDEGDRFTWSNTEGLLNPADPDRPRPASSWATHPNTISIFTMRVPQGM